MFLCQAQAGPAAATDKTQHVREGEEVMEGQVMETKVIEERGVTHSTFVIEHSYPTSPERVFAAFSDPAKKRRWFAEGVHKVVDEFVMDFRPAGTEVVRYHYKEGS